MYGHGYVDYASQSEAYSKHSHDSKYVLANLTFASLTTTVREVVYTFRSTNSNPINAERITEIGPQFLLEILALPKFQYHILLLKWSNESKDLPWSEVPNTKQKNTSQLQTQTKSLINYSIDGGKFWIGTKIGATRAILSGDRNLTCILILISLFL
jgi:hypothetical protein